MSSTQVTVTPALQNSGNVEIIGVGSSDGQTDSVPAGFQSYVDDASPTYANPAFFNNVVPEIGPTADLVGWWQFDNGATTTVVDSSGNNNTGTIVGSPTWVTGGNGSFSFNGLSFNGSNYVSINPPSQITLDGAMSISLWLEYPSVPTTRQVVFSLVSDDTPSPGNSIDIELQPDQNQPGGEAIVVMGAENDYGYNNSNRIVSAAAPSAGTWHHIVYTQDDSGNEILYVDGGSNTADTDSDANYTSGPAGVARIASFNDQNNSNDLAGSVGDVRIYRNAISGDDVNALETGQPTVTAYAANIYGFVPTATVTTCNIGGSGCASSTPIPLTCLSAWCSATSTLSTTALTQFKIQYTAEPSGTLIIHGVVPSGATYAVFPDSTTDSTFWNYATNFPATTTNPRSYNVTLTNQAPTDGLIGWWKLNEGQGTTLNDYSGNGYNGTDVNSNGTVPDPVWVPGQDGSALGFSAKGSNGGNWVVANNIFPTLNDYSACAFVEANADARINNYGNGSGGYIIYRRGNGGGDVGLLAYNWGGNSELSNQWQTTAGNAYTYETTNAPVLQQGQWHQICFTYGDSGNVAQFYLDGVATPTAFEGGNQGYVIAGDTRGGPFYIGGGIDNGNQGDWDGNIDDVRIYNRQLSASEIQSIYQADVGQVLAYGSYLPGYSITAGICNTGPNCVPDPNSFSTTPLLCNDTWCSVAPPLSSTQTTNVYFKYVNYNQIFTQNSGDVKVEAVGPDYSLANNYPTDEAPSNFQSFISGTTTIISENPAYFNDIPTSLSTSLFNTGDDDAGNPHYPSISDRHWQVSATGPLPSGLS
jgi:hypothetical protein